MKTIEFMAEESNGVIALPKKYVGKLSAKFKVVIFVQEKKKSGKDVVAKKTTSPTKKLNAIITKTIKKHSRVFEKLAKN